MSSQPVNPDITIGGPAGPPIYPNPRNIQPQLDTAEPTNAGTPLTGGARNMGLEFLKDSFTHIGDNATDNQ